MDIKKIKERFLKRKNLSDFLFLLYFFTGLRTGDIFNIIKLRDNFIKIYIDKTNKYCYKKIPDFLYSNLFLLDKIKNKKKVYKLLKRYFNMSPRDIRKLSSYFLYEKTKDIFSVKNHLNHKFLSSTIFYLSNVESTDLLDLF